MLHSNRKEVIFTMGLVGEWATAVYGAALGFEDIRAAWFMPGFQHGVSECGARELEAAACAPDGVSRPRP